MRRFAFRWSRIITTVCAPAVMVAQVSNGSAPSVSAPSPGESAATQSTAPPRGGIQARPRADQNSRIAHEELVRKAKQGGIDVYFAGDSITRRWGTSDSQYRHFLTNWTANFFGWNAGNFGWGGDTVQNILWRLENGELDGVHPKVIVLLAGTNNLGDAPATTDDATKVEEVVGGIAAILNVMRQKSPRATILLMGITPRQDRNGGVSLAATIHRINQRLAGLADGQRIRYLDINRQLADPEGRLYEGMTVDGLHLSVKGYQVWADALKPVLTELLGPPAKTDHAPPPTGDPSARRPKASP